MPVVSGDVPVSRFYYTLDHENFDTHTNAHQNNLVRIMQPLYDINASKKATNLSINSDLLAKSRALNINLSATLEQALRTTLAKTEAKKWKADNKAAIATYNDFIESNGCFGDEYRHF